MKDVWDAPDKGYGQEQEVVSTINLEPKQLRSEACTTLEYIEKLRNCLPGLEEVLEVVDRLEHLRTPDKVNYLVKNHDEVTQ